MYSKKNTYNRYLNKRTNCDTGSFFKLILF